MVTVTASSATYNFRQVTPAADGATAMTGTVVLSHGSPSFQLTFNSVIVGTCFPLVVGGVTGGQLLKENPQTGVFGVVGTHASNLVADFQEQYINWLSLVRGAGFAVNISVGSFEAFLKGLDPVNPAEWQGEGGSPGPFVPNPGGTGTTTTATGGGTTTTTTSGNATVTQTTNNTHTYTYTYTVDNSVTNNTTGEPTDLGPLIAAVNDGTAATTANGAKIDATNDKLDELIANGGTGGGIPGPVVGVEPGEGPDLGTATGDATAAGADAAGDAFGSLASTMAISGHAPHLMTLAVPWVDGGTRTYTISSLPESGSSLDSFRIILRIFLGVLVGLAFIFLTVKTLRYY